MSNAIVMIKAIYRGVAGDHSQDVIIESAAEEYQKLPIVLPIDTWISLSTNLDSNGVLTLVFKGPETVCTKATALEILTGMKFSNTSFQIECERSPDVTVDLVCIRGEIFFIN